MEVKISLCSSPHFAEIGESQSACTAPAEKVRKFDKIKRKGVKDGNQSF